MNIVKRIDGEEVELLNLEETGEEMIEYDKSNEFKEYLIYLSKMNFQEVTQQEQGIELYDLFREQLKIKELTEELSLKIKSLNEKAERRSDKVESQREKEIQNKIERFGILLAIVGLFAGGIFDVNLDEKTPMELLIIILILFSVIVFGIPLINENKDNKFIKTTFEYWKEKFSYSKK